MKPELSAFDKILPTILKCPSQTSIPIGKTRSLASASQAGGVNLLLYLNKYTTFKRFGNEFFQSEHLASSSPARKATVRAILSYLIIPAKARHEAPHILLQELNLRTMPPYQQQGQPSALSANLTTYPTSQYGESVVAGAANVDI